MTLPAKSTDSPSGAATFQRQNYGQSAHAEVDDKSPANIYIYDMAFIQPSSKSFIYAGAIVNDDSSTNPNNKKRGAIFNAGATDASYDNNDFNNGAMFTDTHGTSLHQLTDLTNGMDIA